jgi:hypothetical protein
MKLRYVGDKVVTFITGSVGTVVPGETFSVSEELTSVFLRRGDVTQVVDVEPPSRPVKSPKRPRDEDPTPAPVGDEGPRE